MRVLTSEQMTAFDRWAIDEVGLPEDVLIENVAVAVADAAIEQFSPLSVLVLCGPGNNGADGFAAARQLLARRVDVRCVRFGEARAESARQRQEEAWRRLGGVTADSDTEATVEEDLIVDALFGTGLSRPLRGEVARWVRRLEALDTAVLSVDVPSGLDATTARVVGDDADEVAVQADLTVACGALKLCHVLHPGADRCGNIAVTDLGVPYRDRGSGPRQSVLEIEGVSRLLRPRSRVAHKGTFGHCMLFAGSASMAGAGMLAAKGSVRSGAGLTTLATAAGSASILAGLPEAMVRGFDPADGKLDTLLSWFNERSSGVIGPGLGRDPRARLLCEGLIARAEVPMVIDADALTSLTTDARAGEGSLVLTPHPGEMARLQETTVAEVEADRLGCARAAAQRFGAVVVLKGAATIVAEPEGEAWINSSGSALLASGGSGDVLAGLIGGLLAQGYPALDAALLGVFSHGLAADQLAGEARLGLGANRVAEQIPVALEACFLAAESGLAE